MSVPTSPQGFGEESPYSLRNRQGSGFVGGAPSTPIGSSLPAPTVGSADKRNSNSSSQIIRSSGSNPSDEVDALEKQLEVELKIRTGAENLLRTVKKKGEKDQVMVKLAESSKRIELIREKIAAFNNKVITRFGCAHTLSDLMDMIDNMNLSDEAIVKRIEFLKEKITVEMKLKSGAENLAKVYGASMADQKHMAEIFQKIMDLNNKINLLKVALQKYEAKVGIYEDSGASQEALKAMTLESKEETHHWKRVSLTGKMKIKVISARNLAAAHRKLDARVVVRINNQVNKKNDTRTSVKNGTNEPEWNETIELNLDGANEVELHLFDKNDIFAIAFFDIKPFAGDQPETTELDVGLEMEPRGELLVHVSWAPRQSGLQRRDNIARRGAVKTPQIPIAMIKLFGFKQSVDMAGSAQKATATRKRTLMHEKDASKKADRSSMDIAPSSPLPTSPISALALAAAHSPVRSARMEDFTLIRVLGKGNFGKVMLVEEKSTKNVYAIKVLKKDFIIENDEVSSVKTEKKVFQFANQARHPFLVKLHSCFQTKDRIFFVMEYVSGGDLMMHIQRALFNEARAKMYAAEVLLALEYLHSQSIVYRDLKLDNILLDLDGHIKVADYGLCKESMGFGRTTHTFCGTPEFMAPEILLEQAYGRAVDWWAFGVLIYEMLLAQSPFKGDEEEEIFDAILTADVIYPSKLAPASVSILQALLQRDPAKRLGASESDAADVKAHPFFADMKWEAILKKQVPVTFKPTVRDVRDTNNFDPEFTREVPQLTPFDSTLTAVDQREFDGFDFTAESLDSNETAV